MQRPGHRGDDEIGVRDLHAMRSLDDRNPPLARRIERRRIHFACDEEMRHARPALRRPFGHNAADRAHRLGRARRSRRRRRRRSGGSRGRRSGAGGGLHDVLGENLTARPRAAKLCDVHAVLTRETTSLRRDLCPCSGDRLRRGRRGRNGRSRGSRVHLAAGLSRSNVGRRLLAWLQQPRNRLADRNDVAFLRCDPAKDAVTCCFDFDDRLVGLDLEQHLALLHLLAGLFLPRDQLARFLRHLQRRHHDANCH